ncbi:MAG TPA: type II toxin-antitoxin system HicA family toxin [Puia sp.]|nr:type II toxin-antitoxin system HicA family toxin [Puia sp.]
MNSFEITQLLKDNGWVVKAQIGSHMQFVHPTKPGKITVAFHGKKEIPPGTLNRILKQAGLK